MFIHGETELAEACGVAVKHLQRVRVKNLRQGVDWDLNHLRVAYQKNAVPRVMELVTERAVSPAELAAVLEKSLLTEAKKTAPEVEGIVKRFYMNPHLLGIELPSKALVNIRVKTTENFREGMSVPVRELEAGRYELAKKLPRFPGRF
jgi:hypothetical protein